MASRKIGVEIEFGNLAPKACTEIVSSHFNWDFKEIHSNLYIIDSPHGEFKVETDADLIKNLAKRSKSNREANEIDFDGVIRETIQPFTETFVPVELVSPPLNLKDLTLMNQICDLLYKSGARGTSESFNYAFGAHLNPEVEEVDASYILQHLQAFIILSDWLKDQIKIDSTRRLTGFAKDFPNKYIELIIDNSYSPTMDQLIKDYLEYNPTRNRSLDMLPLFKHINEKLIIKEVQDTRVKSRPTFHYRLPNCQIGIPFWSISTEWQRWQTVELLANNPNVLKTAIEVYQKYRLPRLSSQTEFLSIVNDMVLSLK